MTYEIKTCGFLLPLPCSGSFFPFLVGFPLVFCVVTFLERPDLSNGPESEGETVLERFLGTLGMVLWSSWATLYGDTVNSKSDYVLRKPRRKPGENQPLVFDATTTKTTAQNRLQNHSKTARENQL